MTAASRAEASGARPRSGVDPSGWVDSYGDRLFAVAMRSIRHRETAEDLVQETLLEALKAVDTFRGESSFESWLLSILKNRLAMHLRRAHRRCEVTAERLDTWADDLFDGRGVWKRPPRKWWGDDDPRSPELASAFRRCLETLPEGLAEALVLNECNDATAETLGMTLGISEGAVWSRLHRGRLALRDCLERRWFHPDASPLGEPRGEEA